MASAQTSATVSSLMARFRGGDRQAADQLFVLLQPELRRLAALKMGAEASGHSWQPSLLVNELYLRLVKIKSLPSPDDPTQSGREQFLRFAGHLMHHLLIEQSRLLARRITKIDIASFNEMPEDSGAGTLKEIDDLLDRLGAIEPRLRTIVEMKVFEGSSLDEIAARLNISVRAVSRHWTFCKRWLRDKMSTI